MKMHLTKSRLFDRSLIWVAAYIFIIAIGHGSAHAQVSIDDNGKIDFQPRKKKPVSIVVEQGHTTEPILIGYTYNSGSAKSKEKPVITENIDLASFQFEENASLVFNIVGNGEKFSLTNTTIRSVEIIDGAIYLPAIKAGFEEGQGTISLMIDGNPVISDIRISTVPIGSLNELRMYISDDNKALIKMGDNFAVVDEEKWTDMPLTTVSEEYDADGQKLNTSSFGICIRAAWGPGKVKWNGFNPWSVGNRYSYKPENSSALKRGSGSGNNVDAVYRNTWGCGTALKVPDSCTLTVNSNGTTSSCCNAAMMALGHKIAWVNPRNHGFPNCPLKP